MDQTLDFDNSSVIDKGLEVWQTSATKHADNSKPIPNRCNIRFKQ